MTRLILLAVVILLACFPLMAEEADRDLYTNVYAVPPTFLSIGGTGIDRPKALDILSEAGIAFSEGASAIYNPATSQLIVRNIQDQMELVEVYIESIIPKVEKQIYITLREIEFDEKPDFPSDWFDSGDSPSESNGQKKILNNRDELIEVLSRAPQSDSSAPSIAKTKIAGVFDDAQFQLIFRNLANKLSGLEIISAPSVMARSGQSAFVQVGEKRWGIVPVLGADELSIDLELFFPPHGEALSSNGNGENSQFTATIWDGQTIAWTEEKKDGRFRIVFATARLIDPAGLPVNPDAANDRAKLEREAKRKAESKNSLTIEQQNRVKDADEVALRGSQLMTDGDFRGALYKYRLALEWLPEHEMTDSRRTAYEKQLNSAMRQSIPRDSDLHTVEKNETLFGIATNYGVSVFELKELNNLKSDSLTVGQTLVIPEKTPEGIQRNEPVSQKDKARLEEAMKDVVIPSYHVSEIPFFQAVGLIRLALHANLESGLFPEIEPRFEFENVASAMDTAIALRLGNVPVSEALRYVTALANCKYEIQGDRVVIRPD